jgi:hypothetical protein
MRILVTRLALGVAFGLALCSSSAQAMGTGGPPPIGQRSCPARDLSAVYAMVPGSNATGHVEYTLTVTHRSGSGSCALAAPVSLTLLGSHGQSLPTHLTSRPGHYTVVLAHSQFAQAISQLSPDLAGPGEPTSGNCEPVAHALRIAIGTATIRAPMDPTPVCEQGAIGFERLRAVALTPLCTARSLSASFKREAPPFDGFATYEVLLKNTRGGACHADSIVGLRLKGSSGAKLATRVRGGVSSPYVFKSHVLQTAIARLATRGGHCDPVATGLEIFPRPGSTLRTLAQPPVRVCQRGLIELSALFVNG